MFGEAVDNQIPQLNETDTCIEHRLSRRSIFNMSTFVESTPNLTATILSRQQQRYEARRQLKNAAHWLDAEQEHFEARVLWWEKKKCGDIASLHALSEDLKQRMAAFSAEKAAFTAEKVAFALEKKKNDSNKDDQPFQQEGDHGGGEGMRLQISNVMTVTSSNDWGEFEGEEEMVDYANAEEELTPKLLQQQQTGNFVEKNAKLTCDQCDYFCTPARSFLLKRHKKLHHCPGRRFKCTELCDLQFANWKNYYSHLRQKHNIIKSEELQKYKHIARTHDGHFKCVIKCSNQFAWQCRYNDHVRTRHNMNVL